MSKPAASRATAYLEGVRRLPLLVTVPLAMALPLGLSSCTPPTPEPTASVSQTPPATPSAPSSPSATVSADSPTPTSNAALIVTLDDAMVEGDSARLPYARGAKDAWTSALGAEPTESPNEVVNGYDFQQTVWKWPGLQLRVPNDGSERGSSVFVSASVVAGHPIRTTQGIGVGSTRADALAAGAVDGFDATELRLDVRDAPGTNSLQRPNEVGRQFISLFLEGDTVVSIHLPADDFSDL